MSTAEQAPTFPERKIRRELVIGAMLISTFMAAVEVTVISTAMPTIVAQLGGFSLFSWAFGSYLLTQAVTTPLYGRLADSYGRKRVYLASAALFLVGSLLCGCAWSMGSLIFFRALQGIGGGGLVPMATTIIGDVSEPVDRPRMMGYVSGIWGISAIVGPLLGALFVNSLGWPFVFWVNLPIGLLAMAMVARFLHEPPRTGRHQPIDLAGASLLVVGVGALMVALVQIETLSVAALGGLAALGAATLGGFAWRERRVADPLLPAHLLRRPIILAANASALLCGALLIGGSAFLPTWVQGVDGGDALAAGIVLGVMTVSWTVASLSMSRILARVSFRPVAICASIVLVAGSIGLALVTAHQDGLWLDLSCVAIGVGLGLNSLVFTVAVQSSVARADRGRATALFYFSRLLGQALGAAAFGGVLNRGLERTAPGIHDIVRDLVSPARRADLGMVELARLVATLEGALHDVFLLAAAVAVGALLVTLFVPRMARLGLEE
ncbi:MAG TPA: MDR family MFS transporter [Aliidongia sp.]|uniref:MDR family MFS transporter n=1 Tax=Aliidongia sp. TaxID=1914230 RepID=UPI002DDD0785|nr:MDR family MFS transporter [Aliidongia sp.]HEV2678755.1 MDR family MFS transporter [Aliidongia sp.]